MILGDIADDAFINMDLLTTLALPKSRDTILHFCEAVQRRFGLMTSLFQRDNGDFVLEGDRESGRYQWMEIQSRRFTAGYFNPPDVKSAYELHRWLLEGATHFLGVGTLDIEALDVMFGFNLDYKGNRDAIIANAVLEGSPLGAIASEIGGKLVECEPTMVVALDEGCHMQARLSLESRSSSFQVRTGQYADDPISIYFTVRAYPRPGEKFNLQTSFDRQCETAEELLSRTIISSVIHPIAAAIAAAQ